MYTDIHMSMPEHTFMCPITVHMCEHAINMPEYVDTCLPGHADMPGSTWGLTRVTMPEGRQTDQGTKETWTSGNGQHVCTRMKKHKHASRVQTQMCVHVHGHGRAHVQM